MNLRNLKWSTEEKKIARKAFYKAYKKEMLQIQEEVYEKVKRFREENDVWKLHDFLSQKRKELDEKYEYRYSILIYVFARLMREGFITEEDLKGLSEEKVLKIKGMLDFQ